MVVNPTRKPTSKIIQVTEQNEKPKRRVSWDPDQEHRSEDLYRSPAFYHRKSTWYKPGPHATRSMEGYQNTSFQKDPTYFSREEIEARKEAEKRSALTSTDDSNSEGPIDDLLDQEDDDGELEATTAQMDSATLEDPELREANMTLEQLKADLKRLEEKFGPRPENLAEKTHGRCQEEDSESRKHAPTPLTMEALAELNGNKKGLISRCRDDDLDTQCGSDSSHDSDSDRDSDEDLDRTLLDIKESVESPHDESDPDIYGDIVSHLRQRSDDDPLVDIENETSYSEPYKYNWRVPSVTPRRASSPPRDLPRGGDLEALHNTTPIHNLNPRAPSFYPNYQRANTFSSMNAFDYNYCNLRHF
ncbi:uncharacterized protein BDZ99DRAFT_467160 [Mytilinidion resinicola]|uniref:Uncharacterized protein n=1 Tax=Mytilinidion resinicola TaxID=574789 RepID=A0A6A6Y7X8_9PEZI|nr:uncharacterized protein BDZ99DRAFT_467160 [Mytilinidion resinicola]KAF2804936.1 hypothetical protein BDZ99DRAFT_467160 [Mytilinidion resinicola]